MKGFCRPQDLDLISSPGHHSSDHLAPECCLDGQTHLPRCTCWVPWQVRGAPNPADLEMTVPVLAAKPLSLTQATSAVSSDVNLPRLTRAAHIKTTTQSRAAAPSGAGRQPPPLTPSPGTGTWGDPSFPVTRKVAKHGLWGPVQQGAVSTGTLPRNTPGEAVTLPRQGEQTIQKKIKNESPLSHPRGRLCEKLGTSPSTRGGSPNRCMSFLASGCAERADSWLLYFRRSSRSAQKSPFSAFNGSTCHSSIIPPGDIGIAAMCAIFIF